MQAPLTRKEAAWETVDISLIMYEYIGKATQIERLGKEKLHVKEQGNS